jgi:hypothetical protein
MDFEGVDKRIIERFRRDVKSDKDLFQELERVCEMFWRRRDQYPSEMTQPRNSLVARLRAKLSHACVDALKPYLIIGPLWRTCSPRTWNRTTASAEATAVPPGPGQARRPSHPALDLSLTQAGGDCRPAGHLLESDGAPIACGDARRDRRTPASGVRRAPAICQWLCWRPGPGVGRARGGRQTAGLAGRRVARFPDWPVSSGERRWISRACRRAEQDGGGKRFRGDRRRSL